MKSPKLLLSILLLFISFCTSFAQVGIGTTSPDPAASLEIDGASSGVLINRVALTGADDTTTIGALGALQEGLLVYNTNTTANADPENDVKPGFYVWDGGSWISTKETGRRKRGWVAMNDANTSYSLPFVNSPDLNTFSNFTSIDLDFNDNLGDSKISGFAPDGYTADDFYDSTNGVLTPIEVGDVILVRLQFDAVPNNNNGVIEIQIDIDSNPGNPGIVIYQKSIPLLRGNGFTTKISETILLYQLGTFDTNGGKIRLAYTRANNSTGSTCTVSNFSMVVSRIVR